MKKILLLTFVFFSVQVVFAQYPYAINQNTNKSNGGDDNGMGSSFLMPGIEGRLDSILVIIRTGSHSNGTLYVYNGNTTAAGSQIYTQALTDIPTGAELEYMLRLTNAPLLDDNLTYTFMIHNAPLRFGYSDTYANGTLWTGQGFLTAGEHTTMDLDFIVYLGAPTLSVEDGVENNWMSYSYNDHTITLKNFNADEIMVTDVQGKVIASGSGDKLILTNSFPEGVYVVSARKDKQVFTLKTVLRW